LNLNFNLSLNSNNILNKITRTKIAGPARDLILDEIQRNLNVNLNFNLNSHRIWNKFEEILDGVEAVALTNT
jgi:hypothetical protein